MQSFLDHLVIDLISKESNLPESCVVFPTRRAGLIFKKKFADHILKPTLLPAVISIDDFISFLSPLRVTDATNLLFELYTCYKKLFPATQLAEFLPWGEMLLKDFNEVDLHLVNAEKLFAHVISLKEIDALVGVSEEETERIKQFWKLFSEKELTYLQQTFLENWQSLPLLYKNFKQQLTRKNIAFSGMAARLVSEGITQGNIQVPWNNIYFAGFYALSGAEKKIMQNLIEKGIAEVYRDADHYYTADKNQEAGKYFRKNQLNQKDEQVKWTFDYFENENRQISILGVPLNIGQAKFTGSLLKENKTDMSNFNHTVVVLPDEKLLMPVLHALPEEISSINVTMGFPIQGSHVEQLVRSIKNLWDNLEKDKSGNSFLRDDLCHLFENNFIYHLDPGYSKYIIRKIKEEKKYTVPVSFFKEEKPHPVLESLFSLKKNQHHVYDFLAGIVQQLTGHFQSKQEEIGLRDFTLLMYFDEELQQLIKLVNDYKHEIDFNDETSWQFILALLKSIRVPFTGEPVSGLQIMGFLETRNLDFENVFILSVNEDVMPGSSTTNSYIPFSIRKAYGLPTYEEQDAIYAYHFYRLLQRAKNIYLLYNSESGGLSGGEKSRYLLQLAYELKNKYPGKIDLKHHLVGTDLQSIEVKPIRIQKKDFLLKDLNVLFFGEEAVRKKWSPTAFTTYITCPLQFYFKYLAGIYEPEEIKQEIDPAVFGNIIHRVMEIFYEKERYITADHIISLLPKIEIVVEDIIRELFPAAGGSLTGKNALLKAVMVDLLKKILTRDKTETPFKIISLEKEFTWEMQTQMGTVLLAGKIDRIDEINEVTRIIDYKTGNDKTASRFDLEKIFTQPAEKASFQLLMYSLLFTKNHHVNKVKAGLYNIKTISQGIDFLNDGEYIGDELLNSFEENVSRLIAEIVNPEIDFYQTPEIKNCQYCAYKDVCKR